MRKELVKNLKERLRNNPAATIASVSQNDWHGNCQCPNCAAIEKEEGSPAGLMLRFVNAVAADIEPEFPNVAISTLAYQYTRKPPAVTKPRHNVIVQLCSIECSFCKPLADERNKAFRDDIIGWSKICDRLYIWDYTTNFRHYVMPHPNLRVLGPNVKFFADHNVKGIFEQGAYQSYGSEMAELRAWVLAKLLWDPSRDGEKLTNEFIEGYYGPAATGDQGLPQSHARCGRAKRRLARLLREPHRQVPELRHARARLAASESRRGGRAERPRRCNSASRWPSCRCCTRSSCAGTTCGRRPRPPASTGPCHDSAKDTYDQFLTIAKKKNVTHLSEGRQGFGELDGAVTRAGLD